MASSWQDILGSRTDSPWGELASGSAGGYDWDTGETAWEKQERLRRQREARATLEGDDDETAEAFRRYQTERDQARAVGVDDSGEGSPGLLSWLADGLDAGRAAVFATGAEVADTIGGGGEGGSIDGWLERYRARQGFGDTEALKRNEDEEWWEPANLAKGVASFVGDVATDPLTYFTFGAAGVGRKAGAEAAERVGRVLGKEVLEGASDDALRTLAKKGDETFLKNRAAKVLGKDPEELAGTSLDDVLRQVPEDSLREFAEEGFGRRMAGGYFDKGARGLREATEELGQVVGRQGDELFDRMPTQLQGGVKATNPIRPKVRGLRDEGARSRLTGGGKVAGPLVDLSHYTRNALRTSVKGQEVAAKMAGRGSHFYADALEKLGKGDGTQAWHLYQAGRAAIDYWDGALQHLDERMFKEALDLNFALKETAVDEGKVRQAANIVFNARGNPELAAERLARAGLDGDVAEQGRFIAEKLHGDVIDRLYAEVRTTLGEREAVGFLNDYVARQLTEEVAEAAGKSGGRVGSSPWASRTGAFATFEWDEATGKMKPRYWDPQTVQEVTGEKIFETDAIKIATEYATRARSLLRQRLLLKGLEDQGVVAFTKDAFTDPQVAASALAGQQGKAVKAVRRALQDFAETEDPTELKRLLSRNRIATPNVDRVARSVVPERVDGRWQSPEGVEFAYDRTLRRWKVSVPEDWELPEGNIPTFASAGNGRPPEEAVNWVRRTFDQPRKAEEVARIGQAADRAVNQLIVDEQALRQTLDPTTMPADREGLDAYLATVTEQLGQVLGEDPAKLRQMVTRRRQQISTYQRELEQAGLSRLGSDDMSQAAKALLERHGVFGPDAVGESMERWFRSRVGQKDFTAWVDDVWRPTFTWWKTMATVGRGPGFSARNVTGGMFNAWLVDTQPRHFKRSAGLMTARRHARKQAEKQMKGSPPSAAAAKAEELFEDQLRKRGQSDTLKAWRLYEQNVRVGRNKNLDAFTTTGASGATLGINPAATRGNVDSDLATLGGVGTLFGKNRDELSTLQSGLQRSIDNRLVGASAGLAEASEDYLRFASFLRGADDFGLDDGGEAAAMLVKASQFDYGDLSDFERRVLKNVLPFYTWARNNVPLQARALLTEPGKFNRLINLNEEAAHRFGADPEDPEAGHAIPEWVRERHGWVSAWSWGDSPITVGIESPAMDLNRWFDVEKGNALGVGIRMDEVINSLNPVAKLIPESFTGTSTFTRGPLLEEEAPWWARIPGVSNVLTHESDGRQMVDPVKGNILRQALPPLGVIDRLVPSTDRYRERWLTSVGSTAGGLPVSTLNPAQERAELSARQRRLWDRIEKQVPFESIAEDEAERLLDLGFTPEEVFEILSEQGLTAG